MRVGEGCMEGVRRGIGLLPHHRVYDAVVEALEGEAYAEDDVVRSRHPQGTVGLEEAPGRLQPPDVELVIFFPAHRANRVTTLDLTLPVSSER